MLHWILTAWNTYLAHPLRGNGYQWWSGPGSDLGEYTVASAIFVHPILYAKHNNCHHKTCWRLGHPHPEHGWPACKRHWHEVPEHVLAAA